MAHAPASQVLQVQLTVIGPSQPLVALWTAPACILPRRAPTLRNGAAAHHALWTRAQKSPTAAIAWWLHQVHLHLVAPAHLVAPPLMQMWTHLRCWKASLCQPGCAAYLVFVMLGFVKFQQTLNISYCQTHNSYWQVGLCSWRGRQLSATTTSNPCCQNATTENAGANAG